MREDSMKKEPSQNNKNPRGGTIKSGEAVIPSQMSSNADSKINKEKRASLTYTDGSDGAQPVEGGGNAAPTSPNNIGFSDTDEEAVTSPK